MTKDESPRAKQVKVIGRFFVDSGSVLIVDPCYVFQDERYVRLGDFLLSEYAGEVNVAKVQSDNAQAVAARTPDGDGVFIVKGVYHEDGRLRRLIIDFEEEGEE